MHYKNALERRLSNCFLVGEILGWSRVLDERSGGVGFEASGESSHELLPTESFLPITQSTVFFKFSAKSSALSRNCVFVVPASRLRRASVIACEASWMVRIVYPASRSHSVWETKWEWWV
jgi:hypothetical protein